LLTSQSSVWWVVAWKTVVLGARLSGIVEEVPWRRYFVTRRKLWNYWENISKDEILLNLKGMAYVLCTNLFGPNFLTATYFDALLRIFSTNFTRESLKTIWLPGAQKLWAKERLTIASKR
jgi:hypothetical protein